MNESLTTSLAPSPEAQDGSSFTLFRKLFFIVSIVFFICLALYLLYQNGRSIYANGI